MTDESRANEEPPPAAGGQPKAGQHHGPLTIEMEIRARALALAVDHSFNTIVETFRYADAYAAYIADGSHGTVGGEPL